MGSVFVRMSPRGSRPKVPEDQPRSRFRKENTVRSFMTRHPMASFLVLFYGLGWACFVPSLLGNQGFGILPADIPLDPFRLLSIAFFAIVPFVVTRIVDGPGSASRLFRQVRHVRVGPQWYLIAVFGPPAMLFLAAILLKGIAPIEALVGNFTSIPTAFVLGVVVLALWETCGRRHPGARTSRLASRPALVHSEPASSLHRSLGFTTCHCSSSSAV
jgi:hypothetical protein